MKPHFPAIYLLIGAPGSGKTTWRQEFVGSLVRSGRDLVVLSTDELIEAWAAARGISYSDAFSRDDFDFAAVEAPLWQAFGAAVAAEASIVVDRTNMTRAGRARFLDHVPDSYERGAVVFQVPREELDRRLAARAEATGKHIPIDAVDRMLASYEAPGTDEFHIILRG